MDRKFFTHGPFLGDLTHSTAKVWFRSTDQLDIPVVLRLFLEKKEVDFRECPTSAENDYIYTAQFQGLKPSSEYEVVFYHKKRVISKQNFTTGSSSRSDLHFVFGSCRYNHWHNMIRDDSPEGDKAFSKISELHKENNLDFVLFLGDQVYADPTYFVGVSESYEDFANLYREAFEQPHFHELLQNVSSYMILDDHEIRNNWSLDMLNSFSFFENREEIYKNGIKNYQLWQHNRNPDTAEGIYWYSFERNGWPFFVMDIRTRRINYPLKQERKTVLGDEQLGDFLEWLYSTKDLPVRFVGSGIPFFPDTIKGEDKWSAFEEERSLILEFLRVENIGKTVFLSGDVHIGMFSRMTCVEDQNINVFNLISSPFYWPYRGMYVSDFYSERGLKYDQWSDARRQRRGMYNYKYTTSDWLRENQFAEVAVDCNGDGWVRHFDMKKSEFLKKYYF